MIIIFHPPRFPWNEGSHFPSKPLPFQVRSCDIIWSESMNMKPLVAVAFSISSIRPRCLAWTKCLKHNVWSLLKLGNIYHGFPKGHERNSKFQTTTSDKKNNSSKKDAIFQKKTIFQCLSNIFQPPFKGFQNLRDHIQVSSPAHPAPPTSRHPIIPSFHYPPSWQVVRQNS